MREITLVPVGGLGNRMKAIASAVDLVEKSGNKLRVVWFRDWGLNAPFNQLFEPINHPLFRLKEASLSDLVLLDRPRKRNFHIPRLYQKMVFHSCLYEQEIEPLYLQGFDFEKWARENARAYLAAYVAFAPYPSSLIAHLFTPVEEIRQEIELRCQRFSQRMVGVHVRRTDNVESIRQSPIELFYKKLDEEIAADNRTGIYLATDSQEVKQEMRSRYGERVVAVDAPAERGSLEGIRDGIADMYTLARTEKIYGSFHSTFSTMAAQLGNIPLEVLKL